MRHKIFVLVINSGERKFGLVVDGLEGEDELVIKALDDQSITTDLVSGASILGDGRVVLILNMIALMERFTRLSEGRHSTPGRSALERRAWRIRHAESCLRARTSAGGHA